VADLVDDLLTDAVGKDGSFGFRRDPAVGGSLEAVRRDDRAVAVEVGKTEDVVAAAVVEILGSDADCFYRPIPRG